MEDRPGLSEGAGPQGGVPWERSLQEGEGLH